MGSYLRLRSPRPSRAWRSSRWPRRCAPAGRLGSGGRDRGRGGLSRAPGRPRSRPSARHVCRAGRAGRLMTPGDADRRCSRACAMRRPNQAGEETVRATRFRAWPCGPKASQAQPCPERILLWMIKTSAPVVPPSSLRLARPPHGAPVATARAPTRGTPVATPSRPPLWAGSSCVEQGPWRRRDCPVFADVEAVARQLSAGVESIGTFVITVADYPPDR